MEEKRRLAPIDKVLIDRNKNSLDDSPSGSLRTSVPELCTASQREVWGSGFTAKAPPRDARLTGGQLTSRRRRRRRCSRRHKSRRVESLARKSIVSGVPSPNLSSRVTSARASCARRVGGNWGPPVDYCTVLYCTQLLFDLIASH